MRILVVESRAPAAAAIRARLEEAGHSVAGPVATTAEALILAERDRPDLALVSAGPHDGPAAGLDLTRILAGRWGVASILVGGQAEDAHRNSGTALGFLPERPNPDLLPGAVEVWAALTEGRHGAGMPAELEPCASPDPRPEPGPDRDHEAERPGDIPGDGWRAVLRRIWDATTERGLWVAAGGVAFFSFSALVGQLMGTAAGAGEGFGWGLAGSLLFLIWSTLFAMRALIEALNHAYRETERRGTLALNGLALLLGACGLGLSIGSVALLTADPAMLGPALAPAWATAPGMARWPLVAMAVAAMLALCYRIGPCRAAPKWRWLSWGAAAGAGLWVLASLGFSAYVRQIAQYEVAYGLAGAVLVLMIWLYLLAYAVLLGAALNAELERQTARDTTVGADRPPGARGASAADGIRA